ncbi:MAG: transglutaminase-like domain-containing protein [Bacteroidota bacterium]
MQNTVIKKGHSKTTELKALMRLLDDPDQSILSQIEQRILDFGKDAIALLEETKQNCIDIDLYERIDQIIQKIQFESTFNTLTDWKNNAQSNLFEAALSISAMHYPHMDIDALRKEMDKITRDVWLELNEDLTPLEKIQILNHIFFDIYSFNGNKDNLSKPQNSLIKDVIESKKGNSVSISILYLEVARRLNMPVYGIDLPQNFVLAYVNNESVLSAKHRVLFYINPFNKGIIFTKKDIDSFLKQINEKPRDSFFQICENVIIVKRLLSELIESFSAVGNEETADTYKRLTKAFD